jgi:hypothetical protein
VIAASPRVGRLMLGKATVLARIGALAAVLNLACCVNETSLALNEIVSRYFAVSVWG